MPDGSINIYIHSSFFSVASGTADVYSSFIAGLDDSIGQRDTSIKYRTPSESIGTLDIPVDFSLTYSGSMDAGYLSTSMAYRTSTVSSGMEVALVSYSVPVTISGLVDEIDAEIKYYTGSTKISGSLSNKLYFTAGELYDYTTNVLGSYWTFSDDDVEADYEVDYTAGGYYDPLIPGPPEDQVIVSGTNDFTHYMTMGSLSNSGTQSQECELFLAGYPLEFHPSNYTYKFHLLSGDVGSTQGPRAEATVISGSVLDIPFDLYSTATASGYYNSDAVCGLVDLTSYSFESEVVSGTISYYYGQVLCAVSGTTGYTFDIDLFPIKISNFSLDIDEYTLTSGTICVDITDDVYNITTSGCYFIIDETVASGTFTPITDGYRMCFDSPDDFASILGATTFTVHAENDNGDSLEQDFYLTSGYVVEYDNRTQDYGYGSQVVVQGSAENWASCPRSGADAYYFTTEPRKSFDLGASIVGKPWGESDLSAEITPTTDTIYFYGKVFRIEVRAKDFAGNVMEPFMFEFRIEDKPN